jgi:hypothetical protein
MAGIKDISGDLHTINRSNIVRPFVHCDYTAQESYEAIIEQSLSLPANMHLGHSSIRCLGWRLILSRF